MRFLPSDHPWPEAALRLDNHVDVLAQPGALDAHPAVLLHFPRWTDGRAYSQAVLLRGRLHYPGEIVATGEVLSDMLPLLRRCGFTAAQLRADQRVHDAERALGYFDTHYQSVPAERAGTGGRP